MLQHRLNGGIPTSIPRSLFLRAIEVQISGNLALVANTPTFSSARDGALDIFDISNPLAPRLLSRAEGEGNSIDVAVTGRFAYLANSAVGLQILDIADPKDPQEVGRLETENRIVNVAAEGSSILLQECPGSSGATLVLVDVSSPTNPLRRGSTFIEEFTERFILRDGRAYVAGTSNGLLIYNINNGNGPQVIGRSPSIAQADEVAVDGRFAYVGNSFSGLDILWLDYLGGPASCQPFLNGGPDGSGIGGEQPMLPAQ